VVARCVNVVLLNGLEHELILFLVPTLGLRRSGFTLLVFLDASCQGLVSLGTSVEFGSF